MDTHVCTIEIPTNIDDPTSQVLQLGTKLKMVEHDVKKAQRELETTCKLLNLSEEEAIREKNNAKKYREDLLRAEDEIKRIKEKINGNMSLIRAREILWDEVIEVIRGIWEFIVIISQEKTLVRDMEDVVIKNKQKYLDRSKFAKIMIDFINSKSTTELKEHDKPNKTTCAVDL